MDTLRQDLLAAMRSLKRSPAFTIVAILTLAVAIGPLTAVFSVVDAVLLRPLPFAHPEQIVQVWAGEDASAHGPTSSADFADWRTMSRSFSEITAEDFAWFNLTGAGDAARPERVRAALVSVNLFRTLGVAPALGAGFTSGDDRAVAHRAILSYSLWMRRFAGDRQVVGREIVLNGERWRIAGVMPAGVSFPGQLVHEKIDLWAPLAWSPNDVQRGMRRYGVTARLRDGVTLPQAQREMDAVAARLRSTYPIEDANTRVRLVPLREELAGGARRALLVLLGAVALVLVIACANTANLMLARARTRQHEISIRSALGAGRRRIMSQLLAESLLLSTGAAALGALAAVWFTALYAMLIPEPMRADVSPDVRVFTFLVLVAVLTGLASGVVPSWRTATASVAGSLRRGGRTTAGRDRRHFSWMLVVLELATANVLLVGASLLARSFDRLTNTDPGFDARQVYVSRISLPASRYADGPVARRFIDDGLARIAAIPGVKHAGAIDFLPFGQSDLSLGMVIERQQPARAGDVVAHYRSIAGDYLDAMRIPLLRGRPFGRADDETAPPAVLVNEAMVRRYWPPGTSPIGERIRLGSIRDRDPSPWMTVIGVVGDVRHWSLTETPQPEVYVSLEQQPGRSFAFVAQIDLERKSTINALRDVLYTVDPLQPSSWQALGTLVDSSIAEPRFRSVFIGAFAAVALTLAVVGLYCLISFGVTQRTRELGVRVALGARGADIVGLVLREGMGLAVIGVAIGIVAALAAARLLAGMLYQVSATDAATFVIVPLVLMSTALIANYLPARRAARVDPVVALQSE